MLLPGTFETVALGASETRRHRAVEAAHAGLSIAMGASLGKRYYLLVLLLCV